MPAVKHATHSVKPKPKPHKHPAHSTKAKPHKKKGPAKIGPWLEIPQDKRKPGKQTNTPFIVIQAWTVELQVAVLMGPGGAQITQGYGNYGEVTRPRNVSLLTWEGRAPYEMTLDLVFQGIPIAHGWGQSVERQITLLEDLATKQPGMTTPPSVRLYGPVPHPELRWLITAISWGDFWRRSLDGARILQKASVTLHEYVEDPYLMHQRHKRAKFRWYVIKHGDTVKSVAKRLLGNPSKWEQIVKLNPGMHGYKLPQPKFKIGTRIKVPEAPQPAGAKHHHHQAKK